ncbi:phosphatidate cytidylyltransferase [Pelagibacterales bacterium SAG-MED14]|nr:phosphatidate cytidylyltransferase [Pelagibacterales bacterium SAG-MED14]
MNNELIKRILSSLILILIVLIAIIKGSIYFNIFLITCFFVILFEWHKVSKKNNFYYLGIIFLMFSFYTTYILYYINESYINFLFILIICVSTDIGGYTFGKLFKGPKLTNISPKKTYSGSIGGFALTILSTSLFFKISLFFPEETKIFLSTYMLAILISFVSQIGDIIISYFKRLNKIKHTGNLIPGHGGLLDRVDGMIFAFPFYYIILKTNLIEFL